MDFPGSFELYLHNRLSMNMQVPKSGYFLWEDCALWNIFKNLMQEHRCQIYIRGDAVKRSHVLFVIASIIMLIGICLFAMPFILGGAPTSLFFIHNNDSNEHEVVVEIFDSNNESIFEQAYELAPEAEIWESKPTWMLLQLFIPSGNKKECTFKATLDDDITEIRHIQLQPWVTAHIILYEDNAETPLSVYVGTV